MEKVLGSISRTRGEEEGRNEGRKEERKKEKERKGEGEKQCVSHGGTV